IYDEDTDNDLAPDVNEGSGIPGTFITQTGDADGDGLVDQFDNFNIKTATSIYYHNVVHSQMGPNGSFNGPVPGGSGAQLPKSQEGGCAEGVDRDWRNVQILPVTLLEFKGNLNSANIRLTWVVGNEVNMSHYIVERSTDGATFKTVGQQVRALGNSGNTNYSLLDNVSDLSTTTVYYRLVQVGKDGSSKLSNVITFKLQGKAVNSLTVNPNPAKTFFVVRVNATKDGNANIRVVDLAGRVVLQQNNRVATGSNAITFNNIDNIAAGTYNVQVMLNDEVMNEKLIIVK
ncbi:MAG TPA: T9SS type A sorting domain-containing protein, partial [Segetibacter sp.]